MWQAERTVSELATAMPDVSVGAVSLQLKTLREAGLVDVRVDHRHRYYQARRTALGPVGKLLEATWSDALWRLKLAAELEETRRGPRARSLRTSAGSTSRRTHRR